MFIVIYQAKGDLNINRKHYGPFMHYIQAEDFLGTLPAAIDCEVKYIEELITPVTRYEVVKGANFE